MLRCPDAIGKATGKQLVVTGMSKDFFVRAISARATRGVLQAGGQLIPCALGRSGLRSRKREGDGATPYGIWRMSAVLVRPGTPRRSVLNIRFISAHDGWCDAPADRNYNRRVRLPYPASHEELWRSDTLYDIVVVLDHNFRPRVRGLGSAVFFHLAENLATPTAGCVAIRRADMLRLLAICGRKCRLVIRPPGDGRRKSPIRPAPSSRRT